MSDLNTAVTLIRTGQKEEAQAILKEIIRTDSHNIPAWFWMVETLETNEDKLRVLEVCRKLNPEDSKVQKAYEMLKEVQAAENQVSDSEPGTQVSEVPPTAVKAEEGVEKELPAAPFASVPVIQAAPGVIVPPVPEAESPKDDEMSAAAFAAIPVIAASAEKFTPPPPPPAPLEEKPATPPFVAGAAVAVAAGSTPAAPAPAFEPAPVEPPSQKPRRKRSLKWLLPAVLISFVVFLCAGVSFIYIRQLFP